MQLKPLDVIAALAVPLIWGMGVVFAKAAIEHFPPILLMALRFSVTALVLVWFVKPPWHLMGRLFVIALISAAVQYSLTFNGLRGLDASTAVLVIQSEVPFLVILGALLLGERPGPRKWVGILIAFLGVALIAGEPRLGDAWWALGLTLGGALTWAVGQVMIRQIGEVGGFTMIAWVAVFAAPQLFVFSLVFEQDQLESIRSADWVVWSTVAYLGLVMTAIGYALWYGLVGRYPVNQVAPFLLLLPVFSVLGGVLLLGETMTWLITLGGIVILAGVGFIVIEWPQRSASAPVRPGQQ